jgi:hypothetical protein
MSLTETGLGVAHDVHGRAQPDTPPPVTAAGGTGEPRVDGFAVRQRQGASGTTTGRLDEVTATPAAASPPAPAPLPAAAAPAVAR